MTNISVSAADIALFITSVLSFGICAAATVALRGKIKQVPALLLIGVWLLLAIRDIVYVVTLSHSTESLIEYHFVSVPLIAVMLVYMQQTMLRDKFTPLVCIGISGIGLLIGIMTVFLQLNLIAALMFGAFIGAAVVWYIVLSPNSYYAKLYAMAVSVGFVLVGYAFSSQVRVIGVGTDSILYNVTHMPSVLIFGLGNVLILLGLHAYITRIGCVEIYGQHVYNSIFGSVLKFAIVFVPAAAFVTVQAVGSQAENLLRQELFRLLRVSSLNINSQKVVDHVNRAVPYNSVEGQTFSRPLSDIVSIGQLPSTAYIVTLEADDVILIGTSSSVMADEAAVANRRWQVTPEIYQALVMQRQSVTEPYKNKLGYWVSGVVPIYKQGTKFAVGALLFDVPASVWSNTIIIARRAVMIVFGIIEILLLILAAGVMHASLIQRLADNAERKSRQVLESLINNLPGYAYMIDADGVFQMINPSMAALIGKQPDEIIGKHQSEVLSPELADVIQTNIPQINSDGVTVEQLINDVLVKGNLVSLVNRKLPVYDDFHKLTGIVGLATDITEILAARKQLAELNQALQVALDEGNRNLKRIETIMRTIPSPIYYKSLTGEMQMCNEAFEELCGLKLDAMLGRTAEQVGIADRIAPLRKSDEAVMTNRQVITSEITVTYPDGSSHEMVVHKAAYIDQRDKVAGLVSSLVDITHLRRVERSLEVSEQRLRQIVSVMSDLVWETDCHMAISFVSDRITPVLGYDPDAVLHTPFLNYVAENREEVGAMFSKDEVVRQREIAFRNLSGEIVYFELSAVPLYKSDGTWDGFRGVARDISERLRAHHEQQRLLEISKKLNVGLSEVVHLISHELKQPIRALSSLAHFLKMDRYNQLDAEGREIVRNMEERTKKLFMSMDAYSLMAEMYSANEPITEVNLATELAQVIIDLNPPRWVTIDISPDMPVLKCRRNLTLNLFKQLLANSVNFMDRADGLVSVDWRRLPDSVYFAVIDNGPGIDPQYHDAAFESFKQIDVEASETRGTGLGLSFARRVVELHGGQIGIQSHINQGTTIWFTIPNDPKPNDI